MRKLLSIFALLCSFFAFGQGANTTVIQVPVSAGLTENCILTLPSTYSTATSKKYALCVFFHGAGELGTNPASIYNNNQSGGPAYEVAQGNMPDSVLNPADGQYYQFIFASPQFNGAQGGVTTGIGSTTALQADTVLTWLIANYRIDTTRIYFTGLSAGGQTITTYLSQKSEDLSNNSGNFVAFTSHHKLAAVAVLSAVMPQTSGMNDQTVADATFAAKTGWWGFGSPNTDTHGANVLGAGYFLNADSAGYTYHSGPYAESGYATNSYYGFPYAGGHCCWRQFYNPAWVSPLAFRSYGQISMYQFFLTNKSAGGATVVTSAYAGTDQSLSSGTTSTTLTGSGTPATGHTISTYAWSRISGPNTPTFISASTASTGVTGMVSGTYDFRLTVTDNASTSASDDVIVTIGTNSPPTANAGTNQTININTASSATLSGSGSAVSPATSVTYLWTKTSGPGSTTITGNTTTTPTVSGLQVGIYVFNLKVTDNNSLFTNSTVTVTVNAGCGGIRRYPSVAGDSGFYFNAAASFLANPGDTLILKSSVRRTYFSLHGLQGTASCPIVITNEGGQAQLRLGIALDSCMYVSAVAQDTIGVPHTGTHGGKGIWITDPLHRSSPGFTISSLSNHIHVANIEISNELYGFVIKNEESCDTTINYPLGVLSDVEVNNCYIHGMNQEGMYNGSTDPAATSRTIVCNGVTKQYIPTPLRNIYIHDMFIDTTNRSGIQLSGASTGTNVLEKDTCYHNGFEYSSSQGANFWFGSMTTGEMRYCVGQNSWLGGIQSYGIGLVSIHDNKIDSSGYLTGLDSVAIATGNLPGGTVAGATHKNIGSANILIDTRNTYPRNTVFTTFSIQNNVLGVNSNSPAYNIFIGQTHAVYNANNQICTNTLKAGGPALVNVTAGIVYTTCGAIVPPCTNCLYVPRKYILIH